MWRAKGRGADEADARINESNDAMKRRHLERLVHVQRGKEMGQLLCEETLPRARRAKEEQVVVPRCGDEESSLRGALASHVIECGACT
jgi:hypothetical protein